MSLGTFLQNRRMSLEMSVLELSDRTELSVGSIRAYEQGRRMPTVESMNKLLVALAITDSSWIHPGIWVEPVTGEQYSLGFYKGDNRKYYNKEKTVDGPLLGLATTEELFRELMARFTTSQRVPGNVEKAMILAEMLGSLGALQREYRTAEPMEQEPEE